MPDTSMHSAGPFEISSDRRICYWLKNRPRQNFGDSLSELLFWALSKPAAGQAIPRKAQGEYDIIYLLGSTISAARIANALECCGTRLERPIAFWGCGAREDSAIPGELLQRCDFLGVRGPLTREVLRLPPETPIGDPGLLLPLIYQPRFLPEFAGKTICVPHFNDRKSDDDILRETGVDAVIRPQIALTAERLLHRIDIINSAAFILSGSLHFCIIAFAYGRPFCFWRAGHLDVPFKWEDFSASIGIGCRYARTLAEGCEIYAEYIRGKTRMPPLAKLVACAPLPAPETLLARAIAFDMRQAQALG